MALHLGQSGPARRLMSHGFALVAAIQAALRDCGIFSVLESAVPANPVGRWHDFSGMRLLVRSGLHGSHDLRLTLGMIQGPHGIRGHVFHRSKIRSAIDRKSTRLNSSHANISYAVICL